MAPNELETLSITTTKANFEPDGCGESACRQPLDAEQTAHVR